MAAPVFELSDLRVSFPTDDGLVQAVRGVDLTVNEGELVGIVGESGSGKSVSFLAVMGLLPQSARITGSAKVRGQELIGVDKKVQRSVRGQKLAIIFQDPLSALNPVHRVGDQIAEMIQAHQDVNDRQARSRAVELPMLGYVAAGSPIEAVVGTETIAVPEDLVGKRDSYVLRVKGDSMIDDQIASGDYVAQPRMASTAAFRRSCGRPMG